MSKSQETTAEFSRNDFSLIRVKLEGILSVIGRAEESAADEPIWCFKEYSATKGVGMLESFTDDLRRSLDSTAAGVPYNKWTRKQRGGGVLVPTPEEAAELEEEAMKAEIDAVAAVGKAKKAAKQPAKSEGRRRTK